MLKSLNLNDTAQINSFDYSFLLKRIFRFIKPFFGRVILGLLIAIPVGALDGVVAYSLKPYLDYVVNGTAETRAIWAPLIPIGIVLFAAIQGCLRYLNDYLTDWTSQKITNSVKIELFKKLTVLDSKFYDINSTGLIMGRFLGDPDGASRGVVDNLKTIIANVFSAGALIVVMLRSSWKLALVGVVVLGVAILPMLLIRKKIKQTSNANMVVGGNVMTNFTETCAGNKTITSYNLQKRQSEYFNKQIKESFDLNMSLVKRAGWMSPIMYFVASIGIAVVMAVGNHLIMTGEMTSGSFASFVTSLLLLYKPVKSLGNTLTTLQGVFVSMGRVFYLFDLEPRIFDKENAIELECVKDGVSFENVSFEYVEGRPVLNNINLNVRVGETLAIVGNSGGGKSTLVNLLPRFYDVLSGSIKINGVDIRDYSLKSLRDNISVVFQDNFLFAGTLRDNLLMGNFNATDEMLEKAIKAAHLDEFLAELPNGLDTVIGERGTSLSGGQRQRVAIARAMVKNAPIIVLDEATSALDNKSEAIVQKALDNLIVDKTVFVIAHRLSTIKNADRIAVINEGDLVELGTHEELMSISDGKYKNLYEMQFKKKDTENKESGVLIE